MRQFKPGQLQTGSIYNISSSYALTASYALNGGTGVGGGNYIATGSVTASVSTGTGSFTVTSGSSTFMFVSSSGNVGIGTSSPANALDVNGTTRLQGRITTTYNSSTTTGIVGAIGSGTDLFGLSHASEGYLLWLTSGFTSPNNYTNGFGLGLGNPNSSNIKLIANSLNITSTNITMPSNNITLGFGGGNQHLIYNSTSPFVGFRYTNAGGWNFDLREESTGTQRFVIFGGTGNVALSSTTDAGYRLDVNGTARVAETITSNISSANWDTSTYNILNIQRNGSTRATFKTNGVFSWNSGTDFVLDSGGGSARTVLSSVSSEILAVANQSGIDYNTRLRQTSGKIAVRVLGIAGTTQNLFEVLTGASINAFQITSEGNVLINAATDTGHKLLVSGSSASGSVNLDNTLYVSGSRVGIGTSTPANTLDVNGTARVQGTTTISKSGSNNYFTFEPSATGTAPFLQAFFQGQTDHRMYFGGGSVQFRNAGTVLKSNIDCGNITAEGTAYLTGAADQSIWLGGSTNNYLRFTDAGVIHIGLIGTADGTSYIQVRTGGATNMSTGTLSTAFFNTGNVGINTTTDAGFRLDVNGTARVQGNTLITQRLAIAKTTAANNTLEVQNPDASAIPNLGVNESSAIWFGSTYGLMIGKISNGNTWLQSTRVDGSATAYNILLQPRGGNVLIGTTTNIASSLLTLESTTQGFLPPRMTLAQRVAISAPASGLIVYETGSAATEGLWLNETTGWQQLLTNSGSQSISGSLNVTSFTASNATISGNVTVSGTASINTLVVNQTQFTSGSNQLGDAADDTQTLWGTVDIKTGPTLLTGSLNLNGFATGSILFTSGSAGVVTGSSNLVWDNTNGRLGIGNITPTNLLTIGQAVASALQSSAAGIFTSNENASNVFTQVAASNDPLQRPVFAGTKARGTLLSPTAVQSGDAITTFLSTAFDGTAVQASAGLSFDAESNASSGNAPQLISFITGTSGASRTTKMQVRSNGNVLINTTTDAGFRLDVNGTARVSGAATLAGTNTLSGTTNVSGLSSNWICQYPSNATVKPLSFSAQSGGATSNNVAIQFGFNFRESGGLFTQDIFQNILYDNTTNNVVTGFEWYTHQTQAGSNPSVLAMALRGKTLSIGTNTPNASAILQADSTTQGFLPPRTNTTASISAPARGLMSYITSSATEGLYYYNSGSYQGWTRLLNDSGSQILSGSLTTTGNISAGGNINLNGGTLSFNTNFFTISNGGVFNRSGGTITLVTDSNTALTVYPNANNNVVQVNTSLGIGKIPTTKLDVAGTTRISGSFNTATSGSILTVIGSGSAQPIFTVQGSQGELFSITDSLSGSLFSVNDISGLPILEVFSDNTTLIGNYQDPMLITTAKVVQTNSGSFTVYSLPTASYDTAFFEYSIKSGSNARAGSIMAIQSGTSVNFTETTTTDFGDTTPVSFTVIVTGSAMALTGSSTSGAWTIKTIVRGL